jgi:hypothetical protein
VYVTTYDDLATRSAGAGVGSLSLDGGTLKIDTSSVNGGIHFETGTTFTITEKGGTVTPTGVGSNAVFYFAEPEQVLPLLENKDFKKALDKANVALGTTPFPVDGGGIANTVGDLKEVLGNKKIVFYTGSDPLTTSDVSTLTDKTLTITNEYASFRITDGNALAITGSSGSLIVGNYNLGSGTWTGNATIKRSGIVVDTSKTFAGFSTPAVTFGPGTYTSTTKVVLTGTDATHSIIVQGDLKTTDGSVAISTSGVLTLGTTGKSSLVIGSTELTGTDDATPATFTGGGSGVTIDSTGVTVSASGTFKLGATAELVTGAGGLTTGTAAITLGTGTATSTAAIRFPQATILNGSGAGKITLGNDLDLDTSKLDLANGIELDLKGKKLNATTGGITLASGAKAFSHAPDSVIDAAGGAVNIALGTTGGKTIAISKAKLTLTNSILAEGSAIVLAAPDKIEIANGGSLITGSGADLTFGSGGVVIGAGTYSAASQTITLAASVNDGGLTVSGSAATGTLNLGTTSGTITIPTGKALTIGNNVDFGIAGTGSLSSTTLKNAGTPVVLTAADGTPGTGSARISLDGTTVTLALAGSSTLSITGLTVSHGSAITIGTAGSSTITALGTKLTALGSAGLGSAGL